MTKLGIFLLSLSIFIFLFFLFILNSSKNMLSNNSNSEFFPTGTSVSTPTSSNISLSSVVLKSLEGTNGTYSIYIKNLKTGENYGLDENKIYQAGSLYKLWLLGPVFERLKSGDIKLTDTMTNNVGVLNAKFGVDSELTELPEDQNITETVDDAIVQMITISHNYSAMLLLDKLSRTIVNSYNISIGLKNSVLKDLPYTTAYDTALFFEKLYKGEIVDKESSDKMTSILKDQTFNDGLPKYLPKDVKVAHKTGDIDMFKHDCGIIFAKVDYVICILSESDSPIGAQERIALISKAVFDYFMK